jgi:hypothetical protein
VFPFGPSSQSGDEKLATAPQLGDTALIETSTAQSIGSSLLK